ncbi:PAS domain-containing protein [Patulibacter sp.]|uniref:PAS domain-containing protein n=1 Tax=Patulibacter sp. TaxID=1912859 RepID=UPI002722A841|nr:PAS domain-containing protein [Patulibacter sp.]MDO9409470.1 PAS domain-containing protein [Patulibacter sp.]
MSVPAISRDAASLEALRLAVDDLDQQVTILGPDGRVVHVNAARRAWIAEDPSRPGPVADHDPLAAAAEVGPGARAIAAGIRGVLDGVLEHFEAEYPCRDRFFALRATPMAVDGVGVLVVRTDVTDRHVAASGGLPGPTARIVSRRVVAQRLDDLLAAGPVGVVSIRPRRTGPRSLERSSAGREDVVRRTAELAEQLLPAGVLTGRSGADRLVVLLPGVDDADLRRAAVPLAAGWRARIGRPSDLEATIETVLALPGERADDVLTRVAGGLALGAGDLPATTVVGAVAAG